MAAENKKVYRPVAGQIYKSVLEISVVGESPVIRVATSNFPENYVDEADDDDFIQMPICFELMQKVLKFIKSELSDDRETAQAPRIRRVN